VTVLGGDGSICTAGKVEEAFAHTKSAVVHQADIAAVAATALTSDGHAGKSYWLTGPEALTPRDRLRILSAVINQPGAGARAVAGRRLPGGRHRVLPRDAHQSPEAGHTPLPTVEEVTGGPGRTFLQRATEHAAQFRGP
jgi:uncharacterized protein YbjT (DUF2867 family)